MLKIFQARHQQYVKREILDVQASFGKSRGTRDQIANICWITEKAKIRKSYKKKCTSAPLTMLKPLTMCIKTNCDLHKSMADSCQCKTKPTAIL